nr:Na+/H+ antiporter NhaC family protein [Acidaminococcus massiliensis]
MMNHNDDGRNLGGLAFLPLLVFLGLYIGCGLCFTLMGVPKPFSFLPRHVALLAGTLAAFYLWKKGPIDEKLKVYCTGMGDPGVMMIVLIYLLAGGFQGAAAAIGGKTSVVNFCLQFIPPSFLIPGVFLMCCFISTAIGTSMGTIAAMAPVAIGVAQGAGLNAAAVCAAVICGSYFGDNLSMISDTTIAAAEGCGSKMRDKFRMNFAIALPAALVSLVLFYLVSGQVQGGIQVGDYDIFQVCPMWWSW